MTTGRYHGLGSGCSRLRAGRLTKSVVVLQVALSYFRFVITPTVQANIEADTVKFCDTGCSMSHGRTRLPMEWSMRNSVLSLVL